MALRWIKRLWPGPLWRNVGFSVGYMAAASGVVTAVSDLMIGGAPFLRRLLTGLGFLVGVILILLALHGDFPRTTVTLLALPGLLLVGLTARSVVDCRDGRCVTPELQIIVSPDVHPGSNMAELKADGGWAWDLSGWTCSWSLRGERFPSQECNRPLPFSVGEDEVTVDVHVQIADHLDEPHTTDRTFTVAPFVVETENAATYADEPILLVVTANGEPLSDSYKCAWTDATRSDNSETVVIAAPSTRNECATEVTPTASNDRFDYTLELTVEVSPENGEPRYIPVEIEVLHPHNHALIVLDVSQRMGETLDPRIGSTPLTVAKQSISTRLDVLAASGGVFAGVQTFGEDRTDVLACENTRSLVSLFGDSASRERVVREIDSLAPGRTEAPLKVATTEALEQLEMAPDSTRNGRDRFYLISITGGGDNCENLDLGEVLDQVNLDMGPVASQAIIDLQLLSVTIGVPVLVEPFELAEAVSDRDQQASSIVLIADEETGWALEGLIALVSDLLSPELAGNACSILIEVTQQQAEFYGESLNSEDLTEFCSSLP